MAETTDDTEAISRYADVVREPLLKREISLGNILLMLGMLASIGAGLYEGGALRQALSDGIASEQRERETAIHDVTDRIVSVQQDIRELRGLILAQVVPPSTARRQ